MELSWPPPDYNKFIINFDEGATGMLINLWTSVCMCITPHFRCHEGRFGFGWHRGRSGATRASTVHRWLRSHTWTVFLHPIVVWLPQKTQSGTPSRWFRWKWRRALVGVARLSLDWLRRNRGWLLTWDNRRRIVQVFLWRNRRGVFVCVFGWDRRADWPYNRTVVVICSVLMVKFVVLIQGFFTVIPISLLAYTERGPSVSPTGEATAVYLVLVVLNLTCAWFHRHWGSDCAAVSCAGNVMTLVEGHVWL